MTLELEVAVSPDHILDESYIEQKVVRESRISLSKISHWKVVKKSIDARAKMPVYRLTIKIWIEEVLIIVTIWMLKFRWMVEELMMKNGRII